MPPFQSSLKRSRLRPLFLALSGSLLILGFDSLFGGYSSLAAEQFAVRYNFFERSLPVADLRAYAETQEPSESLNFFLSFLNSDQQEAIQKFLKVKISVDTVALDKALDTEIGNKFLSDTAKGIVPSDSDEVQALRSAIILGAKDPGGLGIISFLEAYPSPKITIDLPATSKLIARSKQKSKGDNLPSTNWWQLAVQYQVKATEGKQYNGCLFGDSISFGVGNTLGDNNYNFAIGGMSTVSLIEQLKMLASANVKCQKAIVAIGTNDAMYGIGDDVFAENMEKTVELLRSMESQEIVLIPAFSSTISASKNPKVAGTITRVDEINTLIEKVGQKENVQVDANSIQPLFKDGALNENFTVDGVHLNADGLKIYRQALFKILNAPISSQPPSTKPKLLPNHHKMSINN